MITSLKNQNKYQITTAEYLKNISGNESNSNDQILTITNLALQNLKKEISKKNVDIETNISVHKEFKNILTEMVISGQSPWECSVDRTQLSFLQREILNFLRGEGIGLEKLLEEVPTLLSSIVIKKNEDVFREVRELVQFILDDLYIAATENKLIDNQCFHLEVIVGDLLSLYPFIGPKNGGELNIPLRINQEWKKINYQTNPISLTPRWMGSPIVAYGLSSVEGPPIMLFKGTTYPTDKGFGLSILTDLNPLGAVGSYVYSIGKQKISQWLGQNVNGCKALIFGKSLGGAHAWRTALEFPEYVEKVMAYGAPGLALRDLSALHTLKSENRLPEINIFCQKNDPVPFIDHIAQTGINYFLLLSSKPRNHIAAHAEMFSTHEKSALLKFSPSHTSKIFRITLTFFKDAVAVLAFPCLVVILAIYLAVKAVVKFVRRKYGGRASNPAMIPNSVSTRDCALIRGQSM